MSLLRQKRILLTGGSGFIGSSVVENLLQKRGVAPDAILVPTSSDCDLRVFENCQRVMAHVDVVIHLAAVVGGIDYSTSHPASQYHDCALIDLNIFEAARISAVGKLVNVSNICAYPSDAQTPFKEDDLFGSLPARSHIGIGYAKRTSILLADLYHSQYGLNAVSLIPTNAYGPRDNFSQATSHVIPSLIRKCLEDSEVAVWGDGSESRQFLYVEDMGEAIVLAAEKLEAPATVNVTTDESTSIGDLARLIARLTNFRGRLLFEDSKEKGTRLRKSDSVRASQMLGFKPNFTLEDGLKRTIHWFEENRGHMEGRRA